MHCVVSKQTAVWWNIICRHPRRERRHVRLWIVALVWAGLKGASAAQKWFTDDPPLLCISSGAAEVFRPHPQLFWNLEYRPAYRLFQVGPWFSFGTGRRHEFYAAIGIFLNLELGAGWVLTPSFGCGYYHAGRGLDLGFDAEFRSGIELSKRFSNRQRLGIALTHLSNGSLSDYNPGTETLGIVYAIPLDVLWGRGREQNDSAPVWPRPARAGGYFPVTAMGGAGEQKIK